VTSSDSEHNSNDCHPDDLWLEQLTGIGHGADDSAMTTALRAAMLERYQSEIEEQQPADEAELNRLLQRCRGEGLIEEEKRSWWPQSNWSPAFVAVASIALLLVIGVNIGENPGMDDTTYRGLEDKQAIVKKVAKPMQQAVTLQQALQQAVANRVMLFQTDDRWTVSVMLDKPLTDNVKAVLRSYQLNIEKDGKLKVVFAPLP